MQNLPKFRAWDKERKRMSKPFEIGAYVIEFEGDRPMPLQFGLDKDRFEIMISTELYDKNKKEIFSNDIIKIWDGNNEYIKVVEYKNGGYTVDIWEDFSPLISDYNIEIEIIGNSFENPTLFNPNN